MMSVDQAERLADAVADAIRRWARDENGWPQPKPPVQAAAKPSQPTEGMRLTFDANFADAIDWSVWESVPIVNSEADTGSSLPGNGERQWYPNHRYAPLAEAAPWRVDGRELVITATRTPDHLRPHVGYSATNNPGLKDLFGPAFYDFISGRLATHRSFSQTYGYFEAEALLPAGKGLWPAFWLLPLSMAWPPEIDVFEVLGHDPRTIYQTLHWEADGAHKSDHVATTDFDSSAGFHRYGVLWTKEQLTFYLDGEAKRSFPTSADLHQPCYMIVNLAVGGSWPGDPDASTPFPAEMRVRSVRAWAAP